MGTKKYKKRGDGFKNTITGKGYWLVPFVDSFTRQGREFRGVWFSYQGCRRSIVNGPVTLNFIFIIHFRILLNFSVYIFKLKKKDI